MARRSPSRFVSLVDRLDVDRHEAILLIQSGRVMVNGIIARNPRTLVAADASVTFVKERTLRGTIKLRAALTHFGVDVHGCTCLDVGAAAAGFTTALLESGAAKVYAVDTGHGQLRGRLRQDRRVVNLERTNLRDLDRLLVADDVGLVSMDLSYVAVASALPQLSRVAWTPNAGLLALVKPTFELGSARLVADEESVAKAEAAVAGAAESCGWAVAGTTPSPVTGDGGAREIFVHARRGQG